VRAVWNAGCGGEGAGIIGMRRRLCLEVDIGVGEGRIDVRCVSTMDSCCDDVVDAVVARWSLKDG